MIRLPTREPAARSAAARARRAAHLRLVLGPVSAWPEEWMFEVHERAAIAEIEGGLDAATAERSAADAVRAGLLRRSP